MGCLVHLDNSQIAANQAVCEGDGVCSELGGELLYRGFSDITLRHGFGQAIDSAFGQILDANLAVCVGHIGAKHGELVADLLFERELDPRNLTVIRRFQQFQRYNGLVGKGNTVYAFYQRNGLRVGRGADVVFGNKLGDAQLLSDLQTFHKDFAILIRDIGAKLRPLFGVLNLNLKGDTGHLAVRGGFDDFQHGYRVIDKGQRIGPFLDLDRLLPLVRHIVFGDSLDHGIGLANSESGNADLAVLIRLAGKNDLAFAFLDGKGNTLNVSVIRLLDNRAGGGSRLVGKGDGVCSTFQGDHLRIIRGTLIPVGDNLGDT